MRMSKLALMLVVAAAAAVPLEAKTLAKPGVAIATAVASAGRSADNVKLDASRKPAQVLQFFGLRRGMQVVDLFGANRYWAEIMAPVVGPRGHVDVWEPEQFADADTRKAFDEFAAKQTNVSLIVNPIDKPQLAKNRYDFAMLNLNYHDLYWTSEKYKVTTHDPAAWLRTLYAAMKHGGTVGVIDHVASPNRDTRATVDTLHRIDPEVLKADFRRAGFRLAASSSMLRNSADDHSLLVFNDKIRGKTDRVVYRFRKP